MASIFLHPETRVVSTNGVMTLDSFAELHPENKAQVATSDWVLIEFVDSMRLRVTADSVIPVVVNGASGQLKADKLAIGMLFGNKTIASVSVYSSNPTVSYALPTVPLFCGLSL